MTNRALLCLAVSLAVAPSHARGQDGTVTLAIGGDVMLADGPGRELAAGRDPVRHVAPILRGADVAVANLECPVATVGKPVDKPVTFRGHPRAAKAVKRHFDAVSLANNHSGDMGTDALVQTMDLLAGAGVPFFGAGPDLPSAHRPLVIERSGLRIALLGYLDFKPRRFEAGASLPGVAWAEDEQVVADIRAARAAGADLVIPFVHWGFDDDPAPTDRQRALGRLMIDAGADLVVGGHPHRVQGVETYKGRLVVYSLGNLVFDGFGPGPGRIGWLLVVTLSPQGTRSWHTVVARLDGRGTPRLDPDAESPCGDATASRSCRGVAAIPGE